LPNVEDVPEAERLAWEKELLGFYVSGHPLARHEELLRMYATATTAELSQKGDGAEVVVGGIVESVRRAVTRKGRFQGQRWARYEFSDLEGTASGVMFAQEYAQYGPHLQKNAIVFIRARVDYQGNEPSLRAQEVVPIERAHAVLAGRLVVELESGAADPATVTQLRDLCASHHGPAEVYVRIRTPEDGTYTIRTGRAMYVEPSARLYEAAVELLGPDKVRFLPREGNGPGNSNGRAGSRRRGRRRNG
jgi:DNA polymerase-3 subunit alpha